LAIEERLVFLQMRWTGKEDQLTFLEYIYDNKFPQVLIYTLVSISLRPFAVVIR